MRTLAGSSLVSLMMLILTAPLGLQAQDAAADNVQSADLAATSFEAFAANPGTVVVWASPIGRLESPASRAIVTAVAIADRRSLDVMRGLRIDLVHLQAPDTCGLRFASHAVLCRRANAAVYFAEDILGRVQDGIARGNAEDSLIISYAQGLPPERTTGVIIGGYTFVGRQPSELIALVERGISELTNAPR